MTMPNEREWRDLLIIIDENNIIEYFSNDVASKKRIIYAFVREMRL